MRPHRHDAMEGSWQYCSETECEAVYYLNDDVVDGSEVITQVGHKAIAKPQPICFCFSHTTDAIAADVAANNGVSTIATAIKTAVANGFCACEHLNPSGNCCLVDIRRTLK